MGQRPNHAQRKHITETNTTGLRTIGTFVTRQIYNRSGVKVVRKIGKTWKQIRREAETPV